jgi:hypothetical protein
MHINYNYIISVVFKLILNMAPVIFSLQKMFMEHQWQTQGECQGDIKPLTSQII